MVPNGPHEYIQHETLTIYFSIPCKRCATEPFMFSLFFVEVVSNIGCNDAPKCGTDHLHNHNVITTAKPPRIKTRANYDDQKDIKGLLIPIAFDWSLDLFVTQFTCSNHVRSNEMVWPRSLNSAHPDFHSCIM